MRLTGNDRRLGPVVYGRTDWRPLRLVWSSGGGTDDGDEARNTLTGYAFGWAASVRVPNLIRPLRIKHVANWDSATVARLGRDWYYETHPREYGFCVSDGLLSLYFGAQTDCSTTTESWSRFLPWTQWRFVRHSFYGLDGEHLFDEDQSLRGDERFEQWREQRDSVPKRTFEVEDMDGTRVAVTTFIEEREWRFGTGWFKWLSIFRRPQVRRSLDIHFGSGVGPDKGSWKGGLVGHSINMLPGELHEAALRRYCEQEHDSRSGAFRLRFIGPAQAAPQEK